MFMTYFPQITEAFLILVYFELFLVLIESIALAVVKKKRRKAVAVAYPGLTKKEKAFRLLNINSYRRIHSAKDLQQVLRFLLILIVLVTFCLELDFVLSDEYSKMLFGMGSMFTFLGLLSLIPPKDKKEQRFWQKYLEEHPENPLMVVVPTLDKSYFRTIRFYQINAYIKLLCGGYAFFIGYLLLQFGV